MRQQALFVMSSLLVGITSFASPELLRALAIGPESKQTGQILLVEGAERGDMQSSPAEGSPSSASEAEQKGQASGDVQERGLRDIPELKGGILTAPSVTTTTTACQITLPATPPNGFWPYEALRFEGSIILQVPGQEKLLPSPYWLSRNGSNACRECTYFGTTLWKSKLGGGFDNSAFGSGALYENNCGKGNTAIGKETLKTNISGSDNTAIGQMALSRNTTGNHNIAVGYAAGLNQTAGMQNIYIDNPGENGESNTIRIGRLGSHTRIFLAGVQEPVSGPIPLAMTSTGQLGFAPSSGRYKEEIHDLGKASEDLRRLRPVTFRYKADAVLGAGVQEYGLIAEEVAEVYPELVGRNAGGEIVTVHYQKLIPMLLNELQKQQNTIQQQQRKNEELEARLAKLESR